MKILQAILRALAAIVAAIVPHKKTTAAADNSDDNSQLNDTTANAQLADNLD